MKKYTLNKDRRLRSLLLHGYFPKELPPPFNTIDFAKYRRSIKQAWNNGDDYPKSRPEIYSTPRIGNWRRNLSIVNPVAQFYLSSLIADEWIKIRTHLNKSKIGAQSLEISEDRTRSIEEPDFRLISMLRNEISSIHNFALVSDISRFYNTLYTHSIPWALHGKSHCKTILNSSAYHNLLGTRLDKAVRKGNDNQTAGIPIGPDTSRILSEIVIAKIDCGISTKLNLEDLSAIRNVDDWLIGFDSLSEAEESISTLSSECNTYELEIHPEKTKPIELTNTFLTYWTDELLSISIPVSVSGQQRNIERFFELAFSLSAKHPSENVLKFSIAIARNWSVSRDNWKVFENYLLRLVRANMTVLPNFVQILANYRIKNYNISQDKIIKLVKDILSKHVPTRDYFEISWALFLVKVMQIRISANLLPEVCKLESSVCALITLDLRDKDLIDGEIDESVWLQSMNKAGLTSEMWLLSYEANLKGWLRSIDQNHVDTDTYFSVLKNKNISFYNDRKNVRRISKEKARPISPELMKLSARLRGISIEALSDLDVSKITYLNRPSNFYGD